MEGSAEDYGLVRDHLRGQRPIATDACRHDAMGYGTVTDYWPRNVPQTNCQMHMNAAICTASNMLQSAVPHETCPAASRCCPRHPL